MTKQDLVTKAIEILENNDEVFIEAVNELDSWDGFAEDFRCWDMDELDDMYGHMRPLDLLSEICSDFSVNDDYFYADMYGLHSTDYIVDVYRDKTDAGEVLDNLVDQFMHVEIRNAELSELVEALYNKDFDETPAVEWQDED